MNKVTRFATNLKNFCFEVMRRYRDDETSLAASSLAYTALLSMVPFMSVLVTVFSAMPLFEDASQQLQDFIFENFVPTTGATIQQYILGFVDKARGLTVTMFLAVFVTSILMMNTMEKALNRIFDSTSTRRIRTKLTMYWAVLTMGPLLVGGGIALSSVLFENSAFAPVKNFIVSALPVMASMLAFFLIYLIVPNRKVKWKHALMGAIFAAVCFELAKKGFALYVTSIPSYQKVYGALATIPLFLIWMFLSWNIILLGGTITSTLETSRWRLHVQKYNSNQRLLVVMEILNILRRANFAGKTVSYAELSGLLYFVPDNELNQQLEWLTERHYITTSNSGDYLLRHDLNTLDFKTLYRNGHFKIPVKAATNFSQYQPLLDQYWQPVESMLKHSIDEVFELIDNNTDDDK
ncbi:YihY family inner membrane protein [Marinicella sp. S1101]|uniref:YihY family inner membrane protein n=1 Tax=Marinicella marina TaxID=2996016 RepID=UPI00226087B6|nr:YihY family inner membrane protein [Marinicella marina]MCX7555125.1 YihY family inner membrane protein [Marinicella marina]MDJ1140334.1 YihY family inner membrane protein [Marinicella marina]